MPAGTLTPSAPLIQGIHSPDVVVDPAAFYLATRRMRYPGRSLVSIAGLGSSDSVELRQTGIISSLEVRVAGTITWGGTITGSVMLYPWPFNLPKRFTLAANGQSQLVSARGMTIRALEFLRNARINDSGIDKTFNNVAANRGTLALSSDDWGTSSANALNPNTTVPAVGTYTVDLSYHIPVCADDISLIGSIYAQSAATNLTLGIDWETEANLVTIGGAATFEQDLQYSVTIVSYSIPNVGGRFVVPDLSHFHQLAETRFPGLGQGINEPLLPGTGIGRRLMRALFQVYSGATPAPLALDATNFSTVAWAYGGADVPESYANGQGLRQLNERQASADLGRLWGVGAWDFASQHALRDVVDQAMTSDLRLQIGLVNAPTSGFAQIAQETLFAAPVGA